MMGMDVRYTGHPTTPTLTQEQLDAWANCEVPDCGNKVTHDSDKCYPHTHGWEAVRRNVRDRLAKAQKQYRRKPTLETLEEIQCCENKLREIKDRV
jgi:hypothetical protein